MKPRNILLHYILPHASTIREQAVSIKKETPIICQTACIYWRLYSTSVYNGIDLTVRFYYGSNVHAFFSLTLWFNEGNFTNNDISKLQDCYT